MDDRAVRCGLLRLSKDDSSVDDTRRILDLLRRTLPAAHILEERSLTGPRYLIEEILRRWSDETELDLILTVGGTMPAPGSDDTQAMPDATRAVVERTLPGVPEQMRAWAVETEPLAPLDRSEAGIRGRTLIVNLPGDPSLTLLFLEAVQELIPPILQRLDPEMAEDDSSHDVKSGLDADEFRRHLNRRAGEDSAY